MGTGAVLAGGGVAVAGALLALFASPWRVALAVEARGEPSGAWAFAGGAQLFLCAVSLARARGAPQVLEVRAFGRRVLRRERTAQLVAPSPTEPVARPARSGSRLDPIDLALFVAGEAGRFSLRDLRGWVRFGLRDVALAGELAGLCAMLSALGSPFGSFRHEVDWSGREHLAASLSVSVRFTPALLFWDTVRFAARSFTRRLRGKT